MKVKYKPKPTLEFEQDVTNSKDAFEFLAEVSEVFEHTKCGCCGKHDLQYQKRTFKNHDYFKIQCRDCSATLDFGQKKDGSGLFPKQWGHYDKASGRTTTQREPVTVPSGDEIPF